MVGSGRIGQQTEEFPAQSVAEARGAAADIAGGPIGSLLLLLGPAPVFFVNSVTYLASMLGLGKVRADLSVPAISSGRYLQQLLEGINYVRSRSVLVVLLGAASLSNVGTVGINFSLVLTWSARGIPVWQLGLLQGSVGLGLLGGSLIAPFLVVHFPIGRLIIVSWTLKVTSLLVICLFSDSLIVVVATSIVAFALAPTSSAAVGSYIGVSTPKEFQGRVSSVGQVLGMSLMPLAPVIAGWLLSVLMTSAAMLSLWTAVLGALVIIALVKEARQLPKLSEVHERIATTSAHATEEGRGPAEEEGA